MPFVRVDELYSGFLTSTTVANDWCRGLKNIRTWNRQQHALTNAVPFVTDFHATPNTDVFYCHFLWSSNVKNVERQQKSSQQNYRLPKYCGHCKRTRRVNLHQRFYECFAFWDLAFIISHSEFFCIGVFFVTIFTRMAHTTVKICQNLWFAKIPTQTGHINRMASDEWNFILKMFAVDGLCCLRLEHIPYFIEQTIYILIFGECNVKSSRYDSEFLHFWTIFQGTQRMKCQLVVEKLLTRSSRLIMRFGFNCFFSPRGMVVWDSEGTIKS